MAEILKGSAVAAALNARSTAKVEELNREGVSPTLAILRVGGRADDISYEKGAMKRTFRGAEYDVEIENPKKKFKDMKLNIMVDGKKLDGNIIPAFKDGTHKVKVTIK